MYSDKLVPILEDIESKETEIAGGAVVGIVLAEVNSLIEYICNLTVGKTKYKDVENEVIEIKRRAEDFKCRSSEVIDKDKDVLEEVLKFYKTRKENPIDYEKASKKAVEFCMNVTTLALDTLKIVNKISKIGNKMLSSDFKICSYYAFASVQSSIVNVDINLNGIEDEAYKMQKQKECMEILEEAKKWRFC